MPLAAIPPGIGRQAGTKPNALDIESHSASAPKIRTPGLGTGEDRTHFQPKSQRKSGRRYAPGRKDCSRRADVQAPSRPRRFWVRTTWFAASHEGSKGLYEARLRAMLS